MSGAPDGLAYLDWSGRDGVRHWGGGECRPCRSCGRAALLVGDDGRPQHKVCAERELERNRAEAHQASYRAGAGMPA
jgi:hypothetical protein